MAYRKIPRKFDCPGIAADLQNQLLYSDDSDPAAIKTIAEILGVEKRTVYATLDGQIKISLDFLHAAVIAINGHPEVAKYLEPEGFRLKKDGSDIEPDKATLAEECLDDVPALAKFHAALADPNAKQSRVRIAMDEVVCELQQNFNKWKAENHAK